jgi:hypothetical protein
MDSPDLRPRDAIGDTDSILDCLELAVGASLTADRDFGKLVEVVFFDATPR